MKLFSTLRTFAGLMLLSATLQAPALAQDLSRVFAEAKSHPERWFVLGRDEMTIWSWRNPMPTDRTGIFTFQLRTDHMPGTFAIDAIETWRTESWIRVSCADRTAEYMSDSSFDKSKLEFAINRMSKDDKAQSYPPGSAVGVVMQVICDFGQSKQQVEKAVPAPSTPGLGVPIAPRSKSDKA